MSTLDILLVDRDMRALAQPVQRWTGVRASQAFNAVGTGEVTCRGTDDLIVAANTADARVLVRLDGQVWAGGPVEKPAVGSYSPDEGTGLVTVNFATFEALLGERLAYPNPAVAATVQATDSWVRTATNAETVMRDLVNLNAGPGALAARQVYGLALGGLAGAGAAIDLSARFEVLPDLLRTAAEAGGGLGWRVRPSGAALLFEVYAPVDRSGYVRFSRGLGNLREYTIDPESPTCTAALVGGDGEGAARQIVERVNASALTIGYRRIEKWIPQGGTTVELNQAGDAALAEGDARTNLAARVIDGPQSSYGATYFLGDLVAVEIAPGYAVTERVVGVELTGSPDDGVTVAPTIGADPITNWADLQLLRDTQRRVGAQERG